MNPLNQFSQHLFWDIKPTSEDIDNRKAFIIKRVLEYGLWADWLLIHEYYGLEEITKQALTFHDLEPRALAFVAQLSGIPREQFLCYTTRQLIPPHWNF